MNIGNGEILAGLLTNDSNAIISSSFADDFVAQKKAYSIRHVYELNTNEIGYLLIDPSIYGSDVFSVPFRMSTTIGPIDVTLTNDFTYTTADTQLPVFNRYGLIDNPVHKVGMYSNITDLVVSSEPLRYTVGSASTNQSSGGGNKAGSYIYTFLSTEKYLLSFKNTLGAGGGVRFDLQFDWYEL